MSVLVTGSAGFIGYHVTEALLERGEQVLGLDDLNAYYDPDLKRARLHRLASRSGFDILIRDLCEPGLSDVLTASGREITKIVHLAAQAGVRHSIVDPQLYVRTNVAGHVALLEAARRLPRLDHIVFASSSSVYGLSEDLPFVETDPVDKPGSVYAATKRSGELIAHSYGHLHGIPQTGLRFFTVYGPWGRPDMAYYSFALAIERGEPLTLFEGDDLTRDFTFIDDIVAGVLRALDLPPDPRTEPVRLLNLGNHRRERVSRLITLLEDALGRRAIVRHAPRPATDLSATWASIAAAGQVLDWIPRTTLEEGVPHFVEWLRRYHRVEA